MSRDLFPIIARQVAMLTVVIVCRLLQKCTFCVSPFGSKCCASVAPRAVTYSRRGSSNRLGGNIHRLGGNIHRLGSSIRHRGSNIHHYRAHRLGSSLMRLFKESKSECA